MDITFIRILLFAFPGILGNTIYVTINGSSLKKTYWDDLLRIFLFTIFSYIGYDLLTSLGFAIGKFIPIITISSDSVASLNDYLNNLVSSNLIQFKVWPMSILSLVGVINAYIATIFYKMRPFNHLAIKMGLTKRVSDESIWETFHKSHSEWFIVSDHKMNRKINGHISDFSLDSKNHELIIKDATIFDMTEGNNNIEPHKVDRMYMSREHDEISIEILREKKNDTEGGEALE